MADDVIKILTYLLAVNMHLLNMEILYTCPFDMVLILTNFQKSEYYV